MLYVLSKSHDRCTEETVAPFFFIPEKLPFSDFTTVSSPTCDAGTSCVGARNFSECEHSRCPLPQTHVFLTVVINN